MNETHIFSLFDPGKYWQAFELEGKDLTVTITRIVGEEVEGEEGRKARKPVIYTSELPRPIVLNKTNAKTLIALYGADYRQWVGKRFVMYPTMVKFGREDVEAIRFRKKVPPAPQQRTERPVKPIAERVATFVSALKTVDSVAAVEKMWTDASKLREVVAVDLDTLETLELAYGARLAEVREIEAAKEAK